MHPKYIFSVGFKTHDQNKKLSRQPKLGKKSRNLHFRSSTRISPPKSPEYRNPMPLVRWDFFSPPSDTHLNAASGEIYLLEHDSSRLADKVAEISCAASYLEAGSPLSHHRQSSSHKRCSGSFFVHGAIGLAYSSE